MNLSICIIHACIYPTLYGKQFDRWTLDDGNKGIIATPTNTKTTFTVGNGDAFVTANYTNIPIEKLTLTVDGGTDSGSYTAGTSSVDISANAPIEGMKFER